MSYFQYEGSQIYYEKAGTGEPLLLLHGNTASSKMFLPVIPAFSGKYTVFTIDFLGCGKSDRLKEWPFDLWFKWSEQVTALCEHNHLRNVNVIGCSGGAIAAINFALEHPDMVNSVVADSFEGISADASSTEQIRMGRNYARQNEGFCSMLREMHGDDWESVIDADTEAIVGHARHVGRFFHKELSEMKTKLLLTGSSEDEMFPKGHYERLFEEICSQTSNASSHIFKCGGHPAMMSNGKEFVDLCEDFFTESGKVVLETERLLIEPMSNAELKGLINRYSKTVPELSQAYEEMLKGCMEHPQDRSWYTSWKMCRRDNGEMVGDAGFKGVPEDGLVEIGYGVEETYENQGFATEGATALVKWALESVNVTGVEAEAEDTNAASIRVLEKIGFAPAGKIGKEGPRYILKK